MSCVIVYSFTPLSTAPTDEDMFGGLLRDEPMELNPCNDSIDDLLMVREPMQLVPGGSNRLATVQPTRVHFWLQKNNGVDVRRCAVCSKKIHRCQATH